MTTKQEIFNEGYDRGYSIASWQDLPEIGTEIKPFTLPNFIGPINDIHDAAEVFIESCCEAEANDRQFSPFEFTAKELNEMENSKPYDVWEEFEDGITAGFEANWLERKHYYEN